MKLPLGIYLPHREGRSGGLRRRGEASGKKLGTRGRRPTSDLWVLRDSDLSLPQLHMEPRAPGLREASSDGGSCFPKPENGT